nr:hypothetical protein CFP56_30220 [Quercus suber]
MKSADSEQRYHFICCLGCLVNGSDSEYGVIPGHVLFEHTSGPRSTKQNASQDGRSSGSIHMQGPQGAKRSRRQCACRALVMSTDLNLNCCAARSHTRGQLCMQGCLIRIQDMLGRQKDGSSDVQQKRYIGAQVMCHSPGFQELYLIYLPYLSFSLGEKSTNPGEAVFMASRCTTKDSTHDIQHDLTTSLDIVQGQHVHTYSTWQSVPGDVKVAAGSEAACEAACTTEGSNRAAHRVIRLGVP